MPISVTNPPSLLNLIQPKEPGASYVRKFGTIPPQVGKFAANTGQVEKLHELMAQAVRDDKPVTDWSPLSDAYLKPSARGKRSRLGERM